MRYLATRLGFYLVALWGSITINFLLPRLAPGDPAANLVSRVATQLTPAQVNAIKTIYGLSSASLFSQYATYLDQLFHGNLGISITYFPTPVAQVISSAVVWTVLLGTVSLILSFTIGVSLGIYAGWKRAGRADSVITPLSIFFGAVPYFWLAMAALYVFGLRLGWFPISHAYSSDSSPSASWSFVGDVAIHTILPVATIVFVSIGGWLILMRSTMISVLSEDYITMATAKGLHPLRIALSYGARNALLPVTTAAGISVGFIVSGALLTEIVFSYPGLGFLLYNSVEEVDYPLIQGLLLIITVCVLAANFLVDLLYVLLDPTVRRP